MSIEDEIILRNPDPGSNPELWPRLSCSDPNQLTLAASNPDLDQNPTLFFQGTGQLKALVDFRVATGDPAIEKLVILSNGNVGIGESNPIAKLTVSGNLKLQQGVAVNEFSNDGNLTDNSDLTIPTEKAVKAYVDTKVTQINTALATKAAIAGTATQDFQARNLTVTGNLDVTGTTTFRNIEQHQGDLQIGNEDTDQVRIHGIMRSVHSSGALQIASPLNVTGNITSSAGLEVKGAIRAGGSDLYFTETTHNHTAIGNTTGFAAIENAANYGALMILGRAGTPKGRYVKLWDYLQVNGGMEIYSSANPTVLRIQSAAGFGAGRIEFWSDPQGNQSEWRPSFIQSTDQAQGTWAGGMAFYVNGRGFERRTAAIEVMRVIEGRVIVNGVVQQSSSRSLKDNIDVLSPQDAIATLTGLKPVKFNYKEDSLQEQHLGFIAEDVPELVASLDRKTLNSMNIVAVLTKVLQEQQATIAALTDRLNALEARQA